MLLPREQPYQFTTYLPRPRRPFYLSDKAEMITTFLAEAKVSRQPTNSGHPLRVKENRQGNNAYPREPQAPGPSRYLGRERDADRRDTAGWSGSGSLDTRFTDSWWAGVGLNLDNWAAAAAEGPFRNTQRCWLTYEGPSEGNTLAVMMSSGAGKTEIKSETAEVGGSSKGGGPAEVPLRNLKNVTFDLDQGLDGSFSVGRRHPAGKGCWRVKDVRLVVKE